VTWDDFLGKSGRPDIGVGVNQPLDQLAKVKRITYEDWSGGVVARGSLEAQNNNVGLEERTHAQLLCTDIEITDDNALTPFPGVNNTALARAVSRVFQQASLDEVSELVYISEPYIGRRTSATVAPTFTNVGLATTAGSFWNAADVASELIFSNSIDHTYVKQPGGTVIADITAQIKAAGTFATQFGRVFAGAYVDPVSGLQGLGIRWNAANGLIDDWTGTGADEELLISNSMHADHIVAIRPLGFDALAILCRNSVWIGYKTNDPDRPADFQERYTGFGCVSEATAVSTPYGVVYLSDSGVLLLTVNEVVNLSASVLGAFFAPPGTGLSWVTTTGTFDINRQRYLLNFDSPQDPWIYEFAYGIGEKARPARWLHGLSAQGPYYVVNFTPDSAQPELLWYIFNGTSGSPSEGTVDASATTTGPVNLSPRWTTGESQKDVITEQYTVVGYEIEYSSNGAVSLGMDHLNPVAAGASSPQAFNGARITIALASSSRLRQRIRIDCARKPIRAFGTLMQIIMSAVPQSTAFKLYRITVLALDNGPGFESVASSTVTIT
jgi:hypothetical protein